MQNPITQYVKSKHIGSAKFNALNKIKNAINNNFIITGSFSLFQFDIIKRPINDLDIIVSNDFTVENLLNFFNGKRFIFSEYLGKTEVRQKHSGCMSSYFTDIIEFKPKAQLIIDGIKVDIFVQEEEVEHKIITYWRPDNVIERKYKVALPKYSINAKQHYVASLTISNCKKLKHQSDIDLYNKLNK